MLKLTAIRKLNTAFKQKIAHFSFYAWCFKIQANGYGIDELTA